MAAEVAEIIQKIYSKAILEIRTLFEDLYIEISPETIKEFLWKQKENAYELDKTRNLLEFINE